ncbi:redoxin domain-containing protein [Soonwooa sp.]|uniref:peroxiredoxin family protein n=1 Tax=Soonwooa sp. TaxID=1938592 RepID=UPI0028AC284B|nr:redoxin domain-containing protein [Soonwooa sp.]
MKKLLLLSLIFPFAFSCQKKEEPDIERTKELIEYRKKLITLEPEQRLKYFSATTISGKTFNTKDYLGKTLVIIVYTKSYLQKSDTYNMPEEVNRVYEATKDKANFIGILEDHDNDQKALHQKMKNSEILFDQIDNTQSTEKQSQILFGSFCYPLKTVIDKNGKIVYSKCGGHGEENLIEAINSLDEKQ